MSDTKSIDAKKSYKLKMKVCDYLKGHKWTDTMEDKPTHLSYGHILQGRFYLTPDEIKEFTEIYAKAIESGVDDLTIVETQKDFSPILVDIDLQVSIDDYKGGRLYDDNMIMSIVTKYNKVMKKYLVLPEPNRIFLLEKEKPTKRENDEKEGHYKDGFHLMFPDLCVHYKLRHLIRHNVVEMCRDDGTFEEFDQSAEKIIDKAVVSSNGWLMYGSRKPSSHGYKVSKVWNNNLEEFDGSYDDNKLVTILSIQKSKYSKKKATETTTNIAESDIDAECSKKGLAHVKNEIIYEITSTKEDEIRQATRYVNMLSDERAENYMDWKYVGWALHNIDPVNLKAIWVEFSKRCAKKFDENECEKEWSSTRTPAHGKLLTIRSLAFWAKQDSPKEYESFMKEEFKF